MLWILALVLLALWVFGLAISSTLGGLLHLLLVLAVIAAAVQLVLERRARNQRLT